MQKLRDQSWLIAAYIRVNNLHYESCMVSGGGGLYLCHQGTAKGLWFNISSIKDTEKETEIHIRKIEKL